MSNDQENPVGFKKPPKASQFQKGKSGNPSGRPKKDPSVVSVLRQVTGQSVQVNGPNGPHCITKLKAALIQLVNKAATGDLKAIKILMQWLSRHHELLTHPETVNINIVPVSHPSDDES